MAGDIVHYRNTQIMVVWFLGILLPEETIGVRSYTGNTFLFVSTANDI